MIRDLVEIGKRWRNVNYPLRQEAIDKTASEFCLSAASFSLALDWMFSLWQEEVISNLYHSNPYKNISNAVQILAGNTPAVITQAFLQGAILAVPQIIKTPVMQSGFPQLLLRSFCEISSALAELFYLDTWQNNLSALYAEISKTDLVIAYGSDETIALLKAYCSPSSIVVTHGHAVSCGIIFKDAANKENLEKLAWDMLSYDQRGCLSPRVTFVEVGGEISPEQCAKIFAEEILPLMAERFPRGGLFPGEATAIMHRKALYSFKGIVYSGKDWTVCYDDTLVWPEEGLPRFMPFKPFSNIKELQIVLQSVKDCLISVGVAGGVLKKKKSGYSKLHHICELGTMQKQLLLR
jgi:hypothetical protein